MPTLPVSKKNTHRPSESFHIALIILCAVGFLVLYFKIDLDSSLDASYVANVSQQVEHVERRLITIEKKMMLLQKSDMMDEKVLKTDPAVTNSSDTKVQSE
ncbi:hypothetical protein IT408_00480 [Candidatus Uhrbacteria bacterium]|nr:hypothetical protein [Candidatus Uhrbacteria bacterium]